MARPPNAFAPSCPDPPDDRMAQIGVGPNRGQTPFFFGIRTLSAEEKRDTVFATKAPGLFCEWEMGWQGAQETGPP